MLKTKKKQISTKTVTKAALNTKINKQSAPSARLTRSLLSFTYKSINHAVAGKDRCSVVFVTQLSSGQQHYQLLIHTLWFLIFDALTNKLSVQKCLSCVREF